VPPRIVDVEATLAHRTDEIHSTKTMIDRVERRAGERVHLPRRQEIEDHGACDLRGYVPLHSDEQRLCRLRTEAALLPQHTAPEDPLSVYEDARDVARTVCTTAAYEQSRKDRKKVEMLFAHLKRILKLDRLRLRGLKGARDEFLMAAAVQNLRRMAKWIAPKPGVESAVAV
jgi:hypothetical protein